ncbi:MAG: ATP-dependent DNA ligase [Pseudomonadota bacterium]
MRAFAALYQALDQTTSTNAKVDALVDYFRSTPAADAAWAVYFLSGRRVKRLVGAARLREWLVDASDLPAWLVEETYASVGDLAETIALLVSKDQGSVDDRPLSVWMHDAILPLGSMTPEVQRETLLEWWHALPYSTCFLLNKLLTGALRVGVSQTLVARALATVADLPRPVIAHRLMGHWTPDAPFYERLLAPDDGEADLSRPYPFFLAAPLEESPEQLDDALGPVGAWQMEWKWDGIRAQIVRRGNECFIWSRGEELISDRFPEARDAAARLPDGTVLDGELLAWAEGGVLPFSQLQRRIGRKKIGKKLLNEVPVAFMAYDVLEQNGADVRGQPMSDRRHALEQLLSDPPLALMISPVVTPTDWRDAAMHRDEARARRVEGLMLKRRDAVYGTGRIRGPWWKWKVAPHTVDAIMLYAQPGHGRRANLYTDYTFAVWDDDQLVPIAKAYSGLSNAEIAELDKWIRRHTKERFGPVRSVEPEHVFELKFEAINASSRHKSGVAVRFPRIARWRRDLGPKDADTLDMVRTLAADVENAS